MIEAGEPLGTRYVVVKAVADARPSQLFEVVDRSGVQLFGQLLHDAAVAPAVAQEVRAALVAMPALPSILKPRDLALSPKALPVAVLERPGGVAPLKDRIAGVVEALGRREAAQWLLRQGAAIAGDLAQVHQSGLVHGSIQALSLVCAGAGEVGMPQLAGFGVNAFARDNDPQRAPSRRSDLIDLLGAMQDLFAAAAIAPEGAAAAKWSILCASAKHGEHPALASGAALASALNEMAALKVDDAAPAPRPSLRAQTLVGPRASIAPTAGATTPGSRGTIPPGRVSMVPSSGRASQVPSSGRATHQSRTGMRAAPPAEEPAAPTPSKWRVSFAVVVPVVLAIAGAVGGAVWYALHLNDDVGEGRLSTRREPPGAPAAMCQGESSAQGQVVADFRGAEFDAVCLPSPDRLGVIARKGTELQFFARSVERGQRFGEPQVVARGAVEFGGALTREGVLWTAWRNGVGDPFGLGRVEGERVAVLSLPIAGWDSIPLRGAMLLEVTPRLAWLVTNVAPQTEGAHTLLLQVTFGPATPEVVAWRLGEGVAESVITGDAPAVLLRQSVQDGATTRLRFIDVSPRLGAIAALRRPADPTAVIGAALPDAVVTRSAPQDFDGAAAGVVRRGVSVGGVHAWLFGRGAVRPAETCDTPERCHTAGPVVVLAFGGDAAPTVTPVIPRGWATELGATDNGGLRVLTTGANVAGGEQTFHVMTTLAGPRAATTGAGTNLATFRSPRVRMVKCGAEAWAVFDGSQPSAALSALPAACLQAP